MVNSLDKFAALDPQTRVYCGHEYTLSNLRFALAVEPDNPIVREREVREQRKRAAGEPTLPSTIGDEHVTNPFLRTVEPSIADAASAPARGDIYPIALPFSRRFARGRMRFVRLPPHGTRRRALVGPT